MQVEVDDVIGALVEEIGTKAKEIAVLRAQIAQLQRDHTPPEVVTPEEEGSVTPFPVQITPSNDR